MKKLMLPLLLCAASVSYAQEHFSGMSSSRRVGILNSGANPSELANLFRTVDVQLFAFSLDASNNKVGVSDLIDGENVEELLFAGGESVDFDINTQIMGPSVGFRAFGWGFGVASRSNIRAAISNVNTELGDAVTNSALNGILGSSTIENRENQRITGTVWGELALSAARKLYDKNNHQINAGVSLKLLFPGTYANLGASAFEGTITNTAGDLRLNNATARVNIAYSGSLANDFTSASDYFESLWGGLNGIATDIGVDYQWKGSDNKYKLKVGAAVCNIGSMTFKDDNNSNRIYGLDINDANPLGGLDLNQFDGTTSLVDVENILRANDGQNGVDFTLIDESADFQVKLPTILNLYADYQIISKLSVTMFLVQRLNDKSADDQIMSQNMFSITPRFTTGLFEGFIPINFNEISGTTAGLGLRLGGFFIGSNSAITAVTSDSKQVDFYIGSRFGI
jgi:hypothetical protein